MSKYTKIIDNSNTPQDQILIGRETEMKKNNAGGFVFELTPLKAAERFLILGSEGGTYYAGERTLTGANAAGIIKLAREGSVELVTLIHTVATAMPTRAPKMEPALFALGICTAVGTPEVKAQALAVLSEVCRIPTHLFSFLDAHKAMGGKTGSRSFQRALQNWYLSSNKLGYHLAKYQGRGGWTNADVLRLARPTPITVEQAALFKWSVKGEKPTGDSRDELYVASAHELLREDVSKTRAIELITQFGFTHEMVPTTLLKEVDVWAALLQKMPVGAMIRNLGRMTSLGLIAPLSNGTKHVQAVLGNKEALLNARIHPLNAYVALRTYQTGKGLRGSLSWNKVQTVSDSLESAFYTCFGNIEPTNKNIMLALDVSGSMGWGHNVMGIPRFTPYEAETVMAMSYVRSEANVITRAFSTGFSDLKLSKHDSLKSALKKVQDCGAMMAGTDCSLPMVKAKEEKLPIDCFMVFTDNETWAGHVHPSVALKQYRQASGRNATVVVNGMTATNFTIADPKDPLMIDVVGFDTSVPQIIRELALR